MKGRSSKQLAAYEADLDALISILTSPMSVREILDEFAKKRRTPPVAATVYARLGVLEERGAVTSAKRRGKIAGKSGQRERVYVKSNGVHIKE